jgi:hypothetical protein
MTCFYKAPDIFNMAIVRQKPVVYCGIVPREPLFATRLAFITASAPSGFMSISPIIRYSV